LRITPHVRQCKTLPHIGPLLESKATPCNATHMELDAMVKESALTFRLDAGLRAILEKAAAKEGRSLGNMVNRILTEWAKANGYMKKGTA
jgi:hypothetical protein